MKKVTILLFAVLLVLISASVALAQYPGTVFWKADCPAFATLRITEAPDGGHGVECFSWDAAEKR